jgi:hypothetical protein
VQNNKKAARALAEEATIWTKTLILTLTDIQDDQAKLIELMHSVNEITW